MGLDSTEELRELMSPAIFAGVGGQMGRVKRVVEQLKLRT